MERITVPPYEKEKVYELMKIYFSLFDLITNEDYFKNECKENWSYTYAMNNPIPYDVFDAIWYGIDFEKSVRPREFWTYNSFKYKNVTFEPIKWKEQIQ